MATVYYRDEPGAPSFSFSSNATTRFTSLKNLLIACLVDGYSGKAPAGWELTAQGTSYIVLRNGTHSGYVCITHEGNQVLRVTLAATYSGVVSNIITGDGVVSGKGSPPQRISNYGFYASAAGSWGVIADEKTFILNLPNAAAGAAPFDLANGTIDFSPVLYVGEDSEGNFISMGGNDTTSTAAANADFGCENGFTSLRYPDTGLLVSSGGIIANTPGLNGVGFTRLYSSRAAVPPYLRPGRISWNSENYFCGYLRGLALAGELYGLTCGAAAIALGASSFTTRDCVAPIEFGDGEVWLCLAVKSSNTPPILATTGPEYW